MSLINWNCRGLGSLSAIPNLKFLVRYYKPDTLFLSETLVFRNKIEKFRYILGFDNCFVFNRQGRSGGLAFFWRNSFNYRILNYSQNHINIEVDEGFKGKWQLTGYYAFPEGRRRRNSWNFIRQLSRNTSLPWCIIGDFNDILHAHEKKGRTERPS